MKRKEVTTKMPKNSRVWLAIVLASVILLGASTAASAHSVRRAHFIRVDPFFYPYWYYPYGFGPYPSQYQSTTGTLKLRADPQNETRTQVYVNGALAAEFKHKHTLQLQPGEYKIEVHKAGYQSLARSIYVTVGQTIELRLTLMPAT